MLNIAPTDQGKIVPPAGEPEEHPPPSDPKGIFLGGLFVLALLTTAFVAREIVPLVFAIVLKLLLQPALRVLERWHIPRLPAVLLLILALFGTIVGLGTAISGPARTWAAKLPEGIPRLEERLSFMRVPINSLQLFLQQVEDIGGTEPSPNGAVSERGAALLTTLFTGTRNFASGFFTTVLFSFFSSRVRRYLPAPPRRDTPALQQQAPSRRHIAADRTRHLCVSGHAPEHLIHRVVATTPASILRAAAPSTCGRMTHLS